MLFNYSKILQDKECEVGDDNVEPESTSWELSQFKKGLAII